MKTEGIFLNLQCDCHRVASIFIKLINRTNFSTWLPDLTALCINGVSLTSRAHIFSIVRTGLIRSIHARAIIGRKRGLAGIGTKLVRVKLLNTLHQVSKLTSTN